MGSKKIIKKRAQRGLSTVELLVASSVILSLSFGVATFLPVSFKSNQNNRERMVSANLFHQVLEEVDSLSFEDLNPVGENEEDLDSHPTKTIIDTTNVNATLTKVGSDTVATGSGVVSIGSNTNTISYPRYVRINNTDYRVDIKVVKGRYDQLMAIKPEVNVWTRLEKYLMPEALAASSVSINVDPGSKTGFINTTDFKLQAVCTDCANQLQYNWSIDGVAYPDTSSISKVFSTPGEKKVNLKVTKQGKGELQGEASSTLTINSSGMTVNYSPNSPRVGETVTFTASCSDCSSYVWSFGDGSIEPTTSNTVTKVYDSAGTKKVNVKGLGGSNPQQDPVVEVRPALLEPQVTLKSNPASGIAGAPDHADTTVFNFTIQDAADFKNKFAVNRVKYTINYGDGSDPVVLFDDNPDDDNYPTVPPHTYAVAQNDPYEVSVEGIPLALGNVPLEWKASGKTLVTADDFIGLNASPLEVVAGSSITFDAFVKGIEGSLSYKWNFDDGSEETGSNYRAHTFALPGTYDVSVQALGGTQPSTSKKVVVLPAPGSVEQAPIKKVYVYIRKWVDQPNGEKVLGSGVFIKGNSDD